MYISNKVTKEQLHKKLQKKLYQRCEIKVQLNPYTSVKQRRKKPKKLFISKRFIICFLLVFYSYSLFICSRFFYRFKTFLLGVVTVLQFFVRFRCPGFGASLVTCGMVRWPPVEVKVEDALALKFTNFKRRLDLGAGNNCVQVSYETLSLNIGCEPLHIRLWKFLIRPCEFFFRWRTGSIGLYDYFFMGFLLVLIVWSYHLKCLMENV